MDKTGLKMNIYSVVVNFTGDRNTFLRMHARGVVFIDPTYLREP